MRTCSLIPTPLDRSDSDAAHKPEYEGKPFLYSIKHKKVSDIFAKHITRPPQLRLALKDGKPDPSFKPHGTPKKVGGQDIWPPFR